MKKRTKKNKATAPRANASRAERSLIESPMGHVHHYLWEENDPELDVWIIDLETDASDGNHFVLSSLVQPDRGAPWPYEVPDQRKEGRYDLAELANEAIDAYLESRPSGPVKLRLVR